MVHSLPRIMDRVFLVVALVVAVIVLTRSIKVIKAEQRGVVFRLGRAMPRPVGPGLVFVAPFIDALTLVSLQEQSADVGRMELQTRDHNRVSLSAQLRYRIMEPHRAVTEIQDVKAAVTAAAETTLRAVVGETDYDTVTSESHEVIAAVLSRLDDLTHAWGVKVSDLQIDLHRF